MLLSVRLFAVPLKAMGLYHWWLLGFLFDFYFNWTNSLNLDGVVLVLIPFETWKCFSICRLLYLITFRKFFVTITSNIASLQFIFFWGFNYLYIKTLADPYLFLTYFSTFLFFPFCVCYLYASVWIFSIHSCSSSPILSSNLLNLLSYTSNDFLFLNIIFFRSEISFGSLYRSQLSEGKFFTFLYIIFSFSHNFLQYIVFF